ncbi:MAG: BACON domain-containing carbohydrate-binding protein, partial [Acidobacteriota bacterium]
NQEIIISSFQYTPSGFQTGFSKTSDTAAFLANSYSVPTRSVGTNCLATVESDSPWLTVTSPALISGGQNVDYSVPDNIGVPRTGNLILQSTNCAVEVSSQVLSVTQLGFVCSPTFDVGSTNVGFVQSVRSVLIRGTSTSCSWAVSSAAPWLNIISAASGAGDGSIRFSADANSDANQRVGALFLDNGQRHFVNQDASGSSLALSPLSASFCGSQPPLFAVAWVSPANVEIRSGSPGGQLFGQFGSSGSAFLPPLADGTSLFLLPSGSSQVLASARISVQTGNCSVPAIAAQGIVNAASFAPVSLAPGTLATVRGQGLAAAAVQANGPQYPPTLGGISVLLSGVACPLLYVSPSQVNFLVPDDIPPGRHLLTIGSATSDVIVSKVSPGIFTLTANGSGVPLASLVAVKQDGSTTTLAPYRCNANGCTSAIVSLPSGTTSLYVVLYGTGIRKATRVAASIGQREAQVPYFGAQPQYSGLDQVNLLITNVAALKGRQSLTLLVDDLFSNSVDLFFP